MKGLQSYQPSNFENDSTPDELEPGLIALVHNSGGMAEAADFFLRTPTLAASNFAALWSTNPKFSALKDLNLLKKYTKNQEDSYNFRLGFALSNRPHLHRAYVVTIYNQNFIAVYFKFKGMTLHYVKLNYPQVVCFITGHCKMFAGFVGP